MAQLRGIETMQQATYNRYVIWGRGIEQQEEVLAAARFAASGTITRDRKLVGASGILAVFYTEEGAQEAARAWVCSHG